MPPSVAKTIGARDSASASAMNAHTRSGSGVSANDAKRLKKRETDRRCQREARQRTKTRIAYLEGLVEELRRKDTSGQVASLMHQLTETRKERDALARTLRGIEESVKGCWAGIGASPGSMSEEQQQQQHQPESPQRHIEDSSVENNMASSDHRWVKHPSHTETKQGDSKLLDDGIEVFHECDSIPIKPCNTPVTETSLDFDLDGASIDRSVPTAPFPPASTSSEALMSPTAPVTPIHCSRCDPLQSPIQSSAPNVWAFAHAVMGSGPARLSPSELALDDRISSDLPVRALAEGWAAAESSSGGELPPTWEKLRNIDETVFGEIGKVERLAILYVMHLLLRYHADGSETAKKQIPAWYLARPSQDFAHSYAIEFFTWPGIRERFIFRPHQYCNNLFWRAHNGNLRILWPESFSACYLRDSATGSYSITPDFELCIRDINSWTMAPDFFAKYPELHGDMATRGTIGRTLVSDDIRQMQKMRSKSECCFNAHSAKDHEEDSENVFCLLSDRPPSSQGKIGNLRQADILTDHDMLWFEGAFAGSAVH